MSVVARVRQSMMTNGGKDQTAAPRPAHHASFSATGHGSLDTSLEDRYQRVVHENQQLKVQRNELQEKLKDLTTKFRRLVRDLKLGIDVDNFLSQAVVDQSKGAALHAAIDSGKVPRPAAVGTEVLAATLETITRERDFLLQQLKVLQAQQFVVSGGSGATSGGMQPTESASLRERIQLQELIASQSVDRQRLEQAQREIVRLQALVQQEMHTRMQLQQQAGTLSHGVHDERAQSAAHKTMSAHKDEEIRNLRIQLQQQQTEVMQCRSTVDHLTRERDTLQLQLRLAKETDPHSTAGILDPMSLLELQQDIQGKSSQIAVLSNRLQFAQSQIATLKGECERLVGELRAFHQQHAEVKKQLFETEHEKASLVLKSERLGEVEQALGHKHEELLRTEAQLLRMAERVQTVSRETEMAVRREVAMRVAEAEQARDEAERMRRAKETALYEADHQASERKRAAELALEEAAALRKEVKALREEKSELQARNALLTGVSTELSDDVHKAVALATMKRRVQDATGGAASGRRDGSGDGSAGGAAAGGILEMFEGLEWSDGWEAAKLRETLATAALDLELAEARVTQLAADSERAQVLLRGISEERDVLLDENHALRRRISGVQTCLAKRQLETYRALTASGKKNVGQLRFHVRGISGRTPTGQSTGTAVLPPSSPPALGSYFITLDGVQPNYETLVSRVFHGLDDDSLGIELRFDDLNVDEVSVNYLRNAHMEFQLHLLGPNDTSSIVGYAEWSGSNLLHNDMGVVHDASIDLCSPDDGAVIATLHVDVDSQNMMLPVLLGAPLHSILLDDAAIASALFALRSVCGIRVQVLHVAEIPATAIPFVFIASQAVNGVCPVRDTVVEAEGNAARLLQRQITARPSGVQPSSSPVAAETEKLVTFRMQQAVPFEFRCLIDRTTVHWVAEGAIAFVVFDHASQDVERHLGMVRVPLAPLLSSARASIVSDVAMVPSGKISVGISWNTIALGE